jgi:hypothetical protein
MRYQIRRVIFYPYWQIEKAKNWLSYEYHILRLPKSIRAPYRTAMTIAKHELKRELEQQLFGGWTTIKKEPDFEGLGAIINEPATYKGLKR